MTDAVPPGRAGYARRMPQLVLLRHGQSQWNADNLFTGWYDVDLTEQGESEARDGRPAPGRAPGTSTCGFSTPRC